MRGAATSSSARCAVLRPPTEISRALGGVTDVGRVLELVVKRSRALVDARAVEISLRDGDEYVLAAVAGERIEGSRGDRIVAPMLFRHREVGTLTVLDRLHGDGPFTDEDERLLQAFATSAATAVATARDVAAPSACGAASRPPSASAAAGRASCTTRRCRSSPGCGAALRRRRRATRA